MKTIWEARGTTSNYRVAISSGPLFLEIVGHGTVLLGGRSLVHGCPNYPVKPIWALVTAGNRPEPNWHESIETLTPSYFPGDR